MRAKSERPCGVEFAGMRRCWRDGAQVSPGIQGHDPLAANVTDSQGIGRPLVEDRRSAGVPRALSGGALAAFVHASAVGHGEGADEEQRQLGSRHMIIGTEEARLASGGDAFDG